MGKDVLETEFLYQPKGRKGWCFRMRTPEALIGYTNPKTGRPYGKEIREGLGTRNLREARHKRDIRLGQIRAEELKARAERLGDMDEALSYAEILAQIDDPELIEATEESIMLRTEKIERSHGYEVAKRWYDAATGKETPLKTIYEKYLEDDGGKLSKSTQINLKTAWEDFRRFCKGDVTIETVDRRMAAEFVTQYLPTLKTPRSPSGPSPATIQKKVTLLKGIWTWAMKRGYIPYEPMTPWDKQAPSKKEVRAAAKTRRPFTAEEVRKLFKAEPAGSTLGDVMRIALLTGVRLSEIMEIDASWVDKDGRGYTVPKGKTESAVRYVPLVGPAQDVIQRRMKVVKEKGSLFPERGKRKSDDKRSPAVSSAFTRLRRKTLGEQTDGELAEHSFRHTWRTAARRAGVDLRTSSELGGWSRGDSVDTVYDHGLEITRYRQEQEKIRGWLVAEGYLIKDQNE
ncbi:MAG: tyrosine-type recombinase/integrase [Alphaproteobacteria bacterium]|nr:tyrosine-type recombinase/integrase [Alphaproteobacteria bacterium]